MDNHVGRTCPAQVIEAMRQVASERCRFGYRRIHVMLDRQGIVMNLKKWRRSTGKRSSLFANVVAASGLWERGAQLHCRHRPTNGGASTKDCSHRWLMPGRRSPHGRKTTTGNAHSSLGNITPKGFATKMAMEKQAA